MAAVELGRYHHGNVLTGPAFFHALLIGNGANEITPERNEPPHTAFDQALHGVDDMHPVLARRIEIEQLLQPVERDQMRLLGNSDGALALHIGMAPHRATPRTGPPDIALQQKQIDHHCDVERAMRVLGEPHAIDADRLFGVDIYLSRIAQSRLGETARLFDIRPIRVAAAGDEFVEAGRVLLDEVMVDDFMRFRGLCLIVGLDHDLAQAEDRRHVSTGLELVVLVRDDGFLARHHGQRVLRVDEGNEPLFDHRVERDDLAAAILQILQIVQEARAVGARVLAKIEIAVGFGQIVEGNGADRRPDHLGEPDRSRLVAHVRTLWQIVVAIRARQQGVEIGSLQPRMAGSVKHHVVTRQVA